MKQIEIPIDDMDIEILGENPLYRFEEFLNETSQNDLNQVFDELRLDISSDDIVDYEINEDSVVIYVDDID